MTKRDENLRQLAEGLKAARAATFELTRQLRKIQRAEKSTLTKVTQVCAGGRCGPVPLSGGSDQSGLRTSSGQLGSGMASTLFAGLRNAITGDFRRVLQSVFSNLVRSIGNLVSRSTGGGLFGGLLGGLVGGGLNLLAGRLFRRKQRVVVDNTVQTEVLNFPQATNLTLAANPASRLFGGRAVVRGPSFTVSIDYRNGAEDIVAAKVAQKLSDLNSMQGVI